MNSKSEYRQLLEYINENVTQIKKKKKPVIKTDIETVKIDSRLKSFFNIGNLQSNNVLKNFIITSLKSDITDEMKYIKSFYTCTEITGCHKKIYFDRSAYDINISDEFLKRYISYLKNTNYRNILLELCNFENNQIIINYKNRVKDLIPAIQNNIMIDFLCDEYVKDSMFQLKCLIYNLGVEEDKKIKEIKVISFVGDNFDDTEIKNIELSQGKELLERINVLRNKISSDTIPDIKMNMNECKGCLYSRYCDKKETVIKKEIPKKIDIEKEKRKQYIRLKNTFLF